MNTLAKKLQLPKAEEVVVLNKPDAFTNDFNNSRFSESLVHTSCVNNAIVFVQSKEGFINQMLTLFPRLLDNSVLWIIYPQKTTKKELASLHIEFDWDFLGDYRLQPTRQVNINSDWNAIKLKKTISDTFLSI
ncbi:hypothetical protein [Pseudofulvibacter geojedonensis]|uniref:Uncharacterized protein n=1 Tax=Pseudofulvibacter geojedonensis TaxID=1123758 RepID=A0ABW3HZS2_9FLAO